MTMQPIPDQSGGPHRPWRLATPILRNPFLHGLVATGIGLGLGVAVAVLTVLPLPIGMLSLLAALAALAVLAIGDLRRVLLAVVIIEIPLRIDNYLLYREAAAQLGAALAGLNISLGFLALAGLYGLWLAELLARHRTVPPRLGTQSLPLLVYVVIATLSIIWARDQMMAAFEIFVLIQSLLLFIYLVANVRTRSDLVYVVALLLAGLALQGLIMIGVRLAGGTIDIAALTARMASNGRIGGTVGSPNNAASYLSLLIPLALSVFATTLSARYRILAATALALGGLGLLLTQSRAGLGLMLMVSLGFCWFAIRRRWLSAVIPLAMAIGIAVLVIALQDTITSRLFASNDQGSAYSRLPLMQLAWRMINENGLTGVGANNFAVVVQQYVSPEFAGQWIYTVHNQYLLIWAEKGLLALIAFLAFLMFLLRQGWRAWQLRDRLVSPLALSLTLGLAGHMLHMQVDVFNGRFPIQFLVVVAALLVIMGSGVYRSPIQRVFTMRRIQRDNPRVLPVRDRRRVT